MSGVIMTRGAKALLTVRGIRWANAPGGRADLVEGDERGHRTSGVCVPASLPASLSINGMYSGSIKFRFFDLRKFPVPAKVRG